MNANVVGEPSRLLSLNSGLEICRRLETSSLSVEKRDSILFFWVNLCVILFHFVFGRYCVATFGILCKYNKFIQDCFFLRVFEFPISIRARKAQNKATQCPLIYDQITMIFDDRLSFNTFLSRGSQGKWENWKQLWLLNSKFSSLKLPWLLSGEIFARCWGGIRKEHKDVQQHTPYPGEEKQTRTFDLIMFSSHPHNSTGAQDK